MVSENGEFMPHDMTRRQWLLGSALTGLTGAVTACAPKESPLLSSEKPLATGRFAHGIASGDPRANSVILWTRLSAESLEGSASVAWRVAYDADFADVITRGTATTSAAKNWTVKVEADALPAGTWLYYDFIYGDARSPVGRTKTLAEGNLDSVRFAVMSCSNWQHGFFNVYDQIAREDNFDALIHLGDYYYEYGAEGYAAAEMDRQDRRHEPAHEIISLDDYRTRHGQYRSDPNLQAMTAKFPIITIWDDHETTNDSWQKGAENHQDGEGDWEARKQAAMRAYYEWMPIRDPQPGRAAEALFRDYSFGDLLSLVTVETRLTARAEPLVLENHVEAITADADTFKANVLGDPSREMFGRVQEDYIIETLTTSKAAGMPWRVMANQVIMGRLLTPDLEPYVDEAAVAAIEKDWAGVRDMVRLSKYNLPVYPDSWDGYPAARNRFYDRLIAGGIDDLFVLTGDAHEFWMNDLTAENGTKVGVECVTSAVSSETLIKYMGAATADYSLLLTQSNPDARYYNALHNGYIDVTFTKDKAEVKMMGVSTVLSTDYTAFEVAGFTVRKQGKGGLKVGGGRGLNLKQKALFALG